MSFKLLLKLLKIIKVLNYLPIIIITYLPKIKNLIKKKAVPIFSQIRSMTLSLKEEKEGQAWAM
jgi:hypothetical protein